MKFMTLVKSSENAGPPPQALFDAIEAHMEEQARSGVLVTAGGLMYASSRFVAAMARAGLRLVVARRVPREAERDGPGGVDPPCHRSTHS